MTIHLERSSPKKYNLLPHKRPVGSPREGRFDFIVASQGFEPQYSGSKPEVLPLDDEAVQHVF